MTDRKPSPRMIAALRHGAADKRSRISTVEFQTSTLEALVGRGLADWKTEFHRGAGTTYCYITPKGRACLRKLDDASAPAAPATPEAKPAAPVKRGDLVVVEMNVPYTVGAERTRTERATEYDVMVVTGLFADGRIKMVRSLAWGDDSAPMKLEGMLYATGERKIVPAAAITDMPGAVAAVRAHTYPNSTTPRRFPSLDAVRDALRPFHAPAADPKITRDDVAEGVRDAIEWLPMGQRPAAGARPASVVLAAELKRCGAVMRKLLKQRGRVPVTTQAVTYHGRVTALLAAARRFEALDAATAPVSA